MWMVLSNHRFCCSHATEGWPMSALLNSFTNLYILTKRNKFGFGLTYKNMTKCILRFNLFGWLSVAEP